MKRILSTIALILALVCVLASCNIPFLPEKETTATTPEETTPEVPTPEETTPEVPDDSFTPSVGLAYEVNADGETCTITGIGTCTDTDIYIGGSIDGYKVTSIGDEAFFDCTSLTSVTIGDSVTSIGYASFGGCNSLTRLVVASENPVYYSERNCIITRNEKVLIQGCNNSVITQDVTSIGDYAFYGCTSLTSVTIPDSVTSIGDEAFGACSSLTSLTIGDSVTSIGYASFGGCNSLTRLVVASENPVYYSEGNCIITRNEKVLIQGCNNSVITQDVTSISSYAFSNCTSLTSVTIPDSVTSIGKYAFWGCTSLTNVTIGDSVTSIGEGAFSWCDFLTSVTFANPNGWWYARSADATSGTNISAKYLADPATAAEYLKLNYLSDYWFRTE